MSLPALSGNVRFSLVSTVSSAPTVSDASLEPDNCATNKLNQQSKGKLIYGEK